MKIWISVHQHISFLHLQRKGHMRVKMYLYLSMKRSMMMKQMLNFAGTGIFLLLFFLPAPVSAQIKPPGYERERKLWMEQREQGSSIDGATVIVLDTSIIIDPETFKETVKIIRDTMTVRAYLEGRLGVQEPDRLLNGVPVKITDPVSYEELIIRWNDKTRKIDTLSRNQ